MPTPRNNIRLRTKTVNGQRKLALARIGGFGLFNQPGSISTIPNSIGTTTSVSSLLGANIRLGMLEGIINEFSKQDMQAIYNDIYRHDHTSGAAVDLRANMPWSDFTLIGAEDSKLQPYYDVIDRLKLKNLHAEISVDNMVSGAFVSNIIYREEDENFSAIFPMNYGDCEILQSPLYTESPIIFYQVPEHIKAFMAIKGSKEVDRIKAMLPKTMVNAFMQGGTTELDPVATLYFPRTSRSFEQEGISYLHRIVPIWLMERLLYRGTLTEATKRQRSTLHITAGNEDWIPSETEMAELIGAFQSTEQDPISAVIATRESVQTNEVRSAGDFWKYTDIISETRDYKMQALGINDSFLSGDASYANMETALTVFVEDIRAYRDLFTERIYYSKLFPLVASINDLLEDDSEPIKEEAAIKSVLGTAGRRTVLAKSEVGLLVDLHMQLDETEKLLIPEIRWHKPLRPEADREYVEMLQSMQELGIPIPIRMLASAGGVNFDQIVRDLPEDKKHREILDEFKPSDGEEDDYDFASVRGSKKGKLQKGKLSNLKNRPYKEEEMEVYGRTKTGKRRRIVDQNRAQRKQHEKFAKAVKNISTEEGYDRALKRRKKLGRRK